MKNKPLVHFVKFRVTEKDLASLDEKVASLFILFGCIHNDLSISIRNAKSSYNFRLDHRESAVRRFELSRIMHDLRHFASRLFEFHKLIERHQSAYPHLAKSESEYEKIRALPGFEHAQNIRNKSTNHFDPTEVKEIYTRNTNPQDFTFYLHESRANSYFPGNEFFFFSGLLEKPDGRELKPDEFNVKLAELYDWTLEAWTWVHETISRFIAKEVIQALGKRHEQVSYFVDAECVGDLNKATPPLVLLNSG